MSTHTSTTITEFTTSLKTLISLGDTILKHYKHNLSSNPELNNEIKTLSFKLSNYKKWLSVLKLPNIIEAIENLSTLKDEQEIELKLDEITDITSKSLKHKLTEFIISRHISDITKFETILNSLTTSSSSSSIEKSNPSETQNEPLNSKIKDEPIETATKKRLQTVKPTDEKSQILFDLERITGIGAAHAKILADLGATQSILINEWNEFVAQDPDNSIIMLEKLIPDPKGVYLSSIQLSKLNRDRHRMLEQKLSKTKFLKHLTHHQLVGVKYLDQIERRIQRTEIQQIEKFLKLIASRMSPDMILTICGSYRRGCSTSGDVDVFLTHKELKTGEDAELFNCNILSEFVKIGTNVGFLIDHLTSEGNTKYMGICILKGHTIAHRIDIRLIPYNSYASALLYFTGSSNFNPIMRNHALKKGYTLSEYGLFKRVKDPTTGKMIKGDLVPATTEEDIFKILDYPYKTPEERDI